MKKLVICLALGILLGIVILQVYNLQTPKNLQSQCYTDLQPSKYFNDHPKPYQIQENGVKFFIEDAFVILKGSDTGSMRPCFRDNSYYIKITDLEPDDIHVGDIISISRQGNKNLLHRVVRIENGGYITKGDNNNIEDEQIWTFDQINGKVVGVLY